MTGDVGVGCGQYSTVEDFQFSVRARVVGSSERVVQAVDLADILEEPRCKLSTIFRD